jgi:hypothetical protein
MTLTKLRFSAGQLDGSPLPGQLGDLRPRPSLDRPGLPRKQAALSQCPHHRDCRAPQDHAPRKGVQGLTASLERVSPTSFLAVELFDPRPDPCETCPGTAVLASAATRHQRLIFWREGWCGAQPPP